MVHAQLELEQCDKAVEWMKKTIELAMASKQSETVLAVLKRNLAISKPAVPAEPPQNSKSSAGSSSGRLLPESLSVKIINYKKIVEKSLK